ncbi:MAG: 30S ribosomal protein S6 [Planctomycetes bacterium]|nr:30S ribosomal protein S6 [Planctomycetota bacterium]MBI3844342.1 30S ribosomal protein S6 [Planctomycetota bacterium]
MSHYEGLFLFASRENKPDYVGVEQHVNEVMAKYGAKPIKAQKWAERKLSYEVKRNRRGAYLLVYFDVDSARLPEIRRDFQISERILRHNILACEEIPAELPEFMEFKEEPLGGDDFRGRWSSGRSGGFDRGGPRGPRRGDGPGDGGDMGGGQPVGSADMGSSRG